MLEAKYVWMNGKIVKWDKATLHASTPIINAGLGVFEGIRAYWNDEDKQLYIFRLEEHMQRMWDSSKIHRMNIPYSIKELYSATIETLAKNEFKEDVYIRPLVVRGGYFFAIDRSPIVVIIMAIPRGRAHHFEAGIRCLVSSWRKLPDNVMPPRAKTCGNYVNGILARLDAKSKGFDDAILLTFNEKVSEATGANVMLNRKKQLITPDVTSDILEGVTRRTLIEILPRELGYEIEERKIDKTELYLADEVFFYGTGYEITPVVSIDNYLIGEGKPGLTTRKIKELYFEIVSGRRPEYLKWLTPVY